MEIAIAGAIVAAAVALALWLAPKGFRTYAANGALVGLALLGAVLDYLAGFNWREVLPPDVAPWAILAVTLLNIVLRTITNTAPGRQE